MAFSIFCPGDSQIIFAGREPTGNNVKPYSAARLPEALFIQKLDQRFHRRLVQSKVGLKHLKIRTENERDLIRCGEKDMARFPLTVGDQPFDWRTAYEARTI